MTALASDSVWRKRYSTIDSAVQDIILPDAKVVNGIAQDQEWCDVLVENERQRIRFHDYADIFQVPGLYEELFYDRLECCSPSCIVNLLADVSSELGGDPSTFKVLDVGAGNGMVGDELQELGVDSVVGIDLIPEAQAATHRDRPGLYEDYYVADLTDMPGEIERALTGQKFNCLTTVAALGFGDIPPAAFLNALSLIRTPGWLAFNIKEDFLRDDDSSGFSRLVHQLSRDEFIQTQCYRRYQHRVSVSGKPLYYVAMIARKLRDIPPQLIADWEGCA